MLMGRGGEDEEPLGPARVTPGLDTPTEEPPNTPSESADRGTVRPSKRMSLETGLQCVFSVSVKSLTHTHRSWRPAAVS